MTTPLPKINEDSDDYDVEDITSSGVHLVYNKSRRSVELCFSLSSQPALLQMKLHLNFSSIFNFCSDSSSARFSTEEDLLSMMDKARRLSDTWCVWSSSLIFCFIEGWQVPGDCAPGVVAD